MKGNTMSIKETPIQMNCPILHRKIDVYIRSVQWEDVFLADFNGCDHYSGASECELCRQKAQTKFTSEHQGTPAIQWRIP